MLAQAWNNSHFRPHGEWIHNGRFPLTAECNSAVVMMMMNYSCTRRYFHNDRTGRWWPGGGVGVLVNGGITKGRKETRGDGCVHYVDFGDGSIALF